MGALYVRSSVDIAPIIRGGGQEKHLRSGTENVSGIVGFGVAVEKAEHMRSEESKRIEKLRNALLTRIQEMIPNVIVNGSMHHRLHHNLHVSIPGISGELLLIYLEKHGVIAATGAACTTASTEPSHVLKAMGISRQLAESSLRFSLGRSTTKNDIATIANALEESIAEIRALHIPS